MFAAIPRESLADRVYRQIGETILRGDLRSGDKLPAERVLAEKLGVNRGALREGLKRLQQADLVQVRHGGATEVRNWREHAGLEMLPLLVVSGSGEINRGAIRGIMSLRTQLAPGVARAAALHASPEQTDSLGALCVQLRAATHAEERQILAHAFWTELVRSSGNLGYQLAFNSLRRTYERVWPVLTRTLDPEFRDVDSLDGIVKALRTGDANSAAAHARQHVEIGERAMSALFNSLPPDGDNT